MQMPSAGSYEDSGLEISELEKASVQRPNGTNIYPHAQQIQGAEEQDKLTVAYPAIQPRRKTNRSAANVLQCVGSSVSHGLETFFYNLGYGIASRPWTVILCCFLLSALCGLGMIKIDVKDSSAPIWIPLTSKVQANQEWVHEHFPLLARYNMLIITADNVLSPDVIREMYKIDEMVKGMVEYNNSVSDVYNYNWTSICIPFDKTCLSRSILELWEFDEEKINALKTTSDVVEYLSSVKLSPVYNLDYVAEDWLGELAYDAGGKIIGAKAAKMVYAIKATSAEELDTTVIAPDLLWETRFIELGKQLDSKDDDLVKSVDIQTVRSFRDEYDQSFQADVILLAAGIVIIICYVAVVMGKFNEVEHKVYLALVGVFGIGLAILVSYGLSSAIGQFYGPIHPILPFLLLGLGVDDMFVIIEAWNNLTAKEKQKPLPEKVALTMQHAGVSITVTSVTDFVAFAIGASTVLPALKSFCVYAALGIFFLFIIQSTFFVAWLTIDQRRQDSSRDACCIWIKYYNFTPNSCSQRLCLPLVLRKYIAPSLTTLPVKTFVISFVVFLLLISSYGTRMLKTDFDLAWFLPTDSYLARFMTKYDTAFNEGIRTDLYVGNISYYNDTEKLQSLIGELKMSGYVKNESMVDWHSSFIGWLKTKEAKNVGYYGLNLPWMEEEFPPTESYYFQLLNAYVGKYQPQFYPLLRWNDSDPYKPRRLEASKISFHLEKLESTIAEVECLSNLENLTESYYGREAFVWTAFFRNWETNRVIGSELSTNLGLAFAAVFLVTLVLVANIWVCLLVCFSVLVTLVNVCGMMYYWGLTIDTLTSILLILSLGLAIDYSAHIGHTFMTIAGSRDERVEVTIATMGAAVINGGFSTFLAFVLLATSNSYAFITFFKVFFLVVTFGLFNSLGLLTVLLSWVGPAPYLTATQKAITSNMSIALKDLSADKHRADLNQLLIRSGGQSAIPSTSNQEKVKQYIDSLPERQQLSGVGGSSDTPIYVELDRMLDDLEQQTTEAGGLSHGQQAPGGQCQAVIHFDNHNDVIENCEKYLEHK